MTLYISIWTARLEKTEFKNRRNLCLFSLLSPSFFPQHLSWTRLPHFPFRSNTVGQGPSLSFEELLSSIPEYVKNGTTASRDISPNRYRSARKLDLITSEVNGSHRISPYIFHARTYYSAERHPAWLSKWVNLPIKLKINVMSQCEEGDILNLGTPPDS